MGNLNKVQLIGKLGKDPEIRYTQGGSALANFSLATEDSYKDKSGIRQKETEWHNCVAWNKTADLVQNYLKKGSQIYIEGKLKTSSWDDKETGKKRYKTEIMVNSIQFLDAKGAASGAATAQPSYGQQAAAPPSYGQPQNQTNKPSYAQGKGGYQNVAYTAPAQQPPSEEEIPF